MYGQKIGLGGILTIPPLPSRTRLNDALKLISEILCISLSVNLVKYIVSGSVTTVWTIEIGVRGGHPPFDYRVK